MTSSYDKYPLLQDNVRIGTAEINVLSVFFERLSETRLTERRWEDCSIITEQQWRMSGRWQWQGVTGGHWDDQELMNEVGLLPACQQHIRGTEVQYRAGNASVNNNHQQICWAEFSNYISQVIYTRHQNHAQSINGAAQYRTNMSSMSTKNTH